MLPLPDRYVVLVDPLLGEITCQYQNGQAAIWIVDSDEVEGARLVVSPGKLRYWADQLEVAIGQDRLAS